MAWPGTLTPNQQTTLLAFMPGFRSDLLLFTKLINNLELLNNVWTTGGVSAINALLSAGDVIPDATGLAGAQTLTAADVSTAFTAIQSFLTSYNTPTYDAYFVRAVGPVNAGSV